jgi:hypothetical protein
LKKDNGRSQEYLANAPSLDVTNAEVFVVLSKSNAQCFCKTLIRRIQICGMPDALLIRVNNEGRCEGQEVKLPLPKI